MMRLNKERSIGLKLFLFTIFVVLISVSATYAYYQIQLNGIESTSTVSLGGSQLEIKYNGTNNITANLINPGWSETKYFNVELKNTTGKTVKYDINIEVVDSNFYTTASSDKGYLQYVLKKCTSASTDTCTEELVGTSIIDVQTGTKKVTTISTTETSGITYYALEFLYPDTGVAQSQKGTDGELVHFSGYVTLVSNTNTKIPVSFADDDWETIAANVQEDKEGTASVYPVGATREIAIEGFTNTEKGSNGLYTVRIANNSNYDCTLESQTACGFVVEFVDIIEQRLMNPAGIYNGTEYTRGTNVGGWPSTAMYKYLNGDTTDHLTYEGTNATLYSKLPSDLQSVITDTTVVSGHGSTSGETNFTSTDKIYLLSTGEIWSDCTTGDNCHDTASYPYNGSGAITTRQLDYYSNKSVSRSSNYTYAVKNYNGTADYWWLRTAPSNGKDSFLVVTDYGDYFFFYAYASNIELAPAFRIG